MDIKQVISVHSTRMLRCHKKNRIIYLAEELYGDMA